MLPPARVALVPYDDALKDQDGFFDELTLVAAALQTQVVRDLAPIWGVTATVAAFSSLDRVPAGYAPLAIFNQPLPLNRAGFHYAEAGPPCALIEYCGNWSTAASHELLEMLCDPAGTKTRLGPSLGDMKNAECATQIVEGETQYDPQGLVAYLMEVCDPCESSTYKIDRVDVSDFVTPFFFDLEPPDCVRYSFTGRITKPFQLLGQGYLTWSTQSPDNYVFQAYARGAPTAPVAPRSLQITRIAETPEVFSRSWIDFRADAKSSIRDRDCADPPQTYVDRTPAAEHRGVVLREELQLGLGSASAPPAPIDLDKIIALVSRLARDKTFYDKFKEHPKAALTDVGITPPADLEEPLSEVPPQKVYQKLLHSLEESHNVGYTFNEPTAIQQLARFPFA